MWLNADGYVKLFHHFIGENCILFMLLHLIARVCVCVCDEHEGDISVIHHSFCKEILHSIKYYIPLSADNNCCNHIEWQYILQATRTATPFFMIIDCACASALCIRSICWCLFSHNILSICHIHVNCNHTNYNTRRFIYFINCHTNKAE